MQLLVLGMHRSGTSVLARLLNMMGAYFGPENIKTSLNSENPKGFWERRDVRQLNDFVLHSVDCDWNRIADFNIESLPAPVVKEFNNTASDIILGMDAHRPWLLKEPRMCLLLELWKMHLEVPVCIHVFRNPLEVAQSLLKRNEIPIHVGIALWEKYNQMALNISRSLPRLVVSHHRLINSPEDEVRYIYDQLSKMDVAKLRLPSRKEISSFVCKDLHHERVNEDKLTQHLNRRQMELYKSFEDGEVLVSERDFELSGAANAMLRDYESNLRLSQEAEITHSESSSRVAKLLGEHENNLKLQAQRFELQIEESKQKIEHGKEYLEDLKRQHAEREKTLNQQIEVQAHEVRELSLQIEKNVQDSKKLRDEFCDAQVRLKKEYSLKEHALTEEIKQLESDENRVRQNARVAATRFQTQFEQQKEKMLSLTKTIAKLEAELSKVKKQKLSIEKEYVERGQLLASKEQTIEKLERDINSATKGRSDALDLAENRLQDIQRLVHWLHVVEFHLGSLRWRGGRLAVGTMSKILGNKGSDINADDINRILERFRSWEVSKTKSTVEGLNNLHNKKTGRSKLDRHVQLVQRSGLFDRAWYLSKYPDVKESGMDPIVHYFKFGSKENRDPGPDFQTKWYLQNYPDVAESAINPLEHYILYGRDELRSPMPLLRLEAPEDSECKIEVIVTVYNALSDVKKCLNSIKIKNDGLQVGVIVVNDGSDRQTSDWLNSFCKNNHNFKLIEHGRNQGYTKAVNSGLKASTAPYVIVLNSDTIVTNGWLTCLMRCINSDQRIGIVGPLSSAASWQSVPNLYEKDGSFAVNALPVGMTPDDMAKLIAATSTRQYPRLPFVNGFCFMIRREVIDTIGFMDEESFPEGYGEENDYCIRAVDAGFELAIADDAFVYHSKSKSFGHERRKELSKKGSDALKRKHSAHKFETLAKQARNSRSLDKIRNELQQKIRTAESRVKPLGTNLSDVLFLLPVRGGSGGAHSVVQEVTEMRRLGVAANIAVRSADLEHLLDLYQDVEGVKELFIPFKPENLFELSKHYKVVVGTIFSSMMLVKQIVETNPHIIPAYYVQDYEPWFFPAGSENWQLASDSYRLVPNAVLFAKTHWIANIVEQKHGVFVHKVSPSLDHSVYKSTPRKNSDVITVAAMIRPKTPRRGAERTMRLLSRLSKTANKKLSFRVFGCLEKDKSFQKLARDFEYQNKGVLTRPEVASLLASSDIFIDLSDYQAFGRTALEAMACGCAVMVPVHGGANEYAIDGDNALVVDTFNEEECFVRLDALLGDDKKLKAMQASAVLTAANYSVSKAAKSELAVLSKFTESDGKINKIVENHSAGRVLDFSLPTENVSTDVREKKLPITALVITWDVGHNPLGRSYILAEVLDRIVGNVVIIGFQFPRYGDDIWKPLYDSKIPVISLPGGNFPEFLQSLEKISERFKPDVIFACKSRLPSVQLGALIKDRIGCPLFIDLDDHELTFFDNAAEVSIKQLEKMDFSSAVANVEPYDKLWTGVAQYLRLFSDEVLVSNEVLQSEFGGTIIPHVRDERVFDSQKIDRSAIRIEFDIPSDAKVLLFFGTPRQHKGIDLLAQSVASIDDDRLMLVVVGDIPGGLIKEKLKTLGGESIKFIPSQPFERIAEIVSLADAICLPQDPSHPISHYQLPAKAIDAIAMGIPLLVTATEPLRKLIELGLAVEITPKTIVSKLKQVMKKQTAKQGHDSKARQIFLEHFSYAFAAETLRRLISHRIENYIPSLGFHINFARFAQAQRRVLGLPNFSEPEQRKSGTDFVIFWKQNDSGIYGRRVDMFVRYLESRDDVRKVVFFDAPISELKLLGFRKSENRTSHERLVYVNSYSKILGKFDSQKVSYNVYTGPVGIYSLPGMEAESEKGLAAGYMEFISSVLKREGVSAKDSVFWFYPRNFAAKNIISQFEPGKIGVDVIDDHRAWPGVSEKRKMMLTENYRYLLGNADLAMVNCEPMIEKMREFCEDIRLVPNGCDSNPSSITPRHSVDFEELKSWKGKTIGYIGNLESKIDFELIEKIAVKFSECKIVLLGSTHTNNTINLLEKRPNIRLPGVVPYEQIGSWIKLFDIGIIPHRDTALTKTMNPLKVFVYLQWGVPIVTTNVENLGYKGPLIHVAKSHDDFLAGVESFLKSTKDNKSDLQSFVMENSWQARFGSHIDELLS